MEYTTTINLPYGKLGETMNWCQKVCKHDWKVTHLELGGEEEGQYTFEFKSEKDYITFIMWKQ